ncbi:MAG: hypothetical protein A3K77_05610 [Euryarchaeota archaeon RBG_13_31_8]|nr:MAG: hypothetical protein A3K77_05610 [Euryarchaeota archaeon RBG_13_31_8]
MVLKKSFLLDEDDPDSLQFEPGDCDGFIISETDGGKTGRIYVYYSERDKLIERLKQIDVSS